MLDFRPPRIEDREWVTHLMAYTSRENCEYCFGNIFNWSPVYDTYITRFGDFFLAAGMGDDGEYCFPMGHGDLRAAVDALHNDAKSRGRQMRIFGLTEEDRAALEALYPDRFILTEDRSFFDYIYSQQDLATLPGKPFHAKRNHIAAFVREQNYTYERITADNLSDCADMAWQWIERNLEKNPEALAGEQTALSRAFRNYEALHLHGGLLRVDGEVVAFTIGERMSSTMFCTHFEKAYADVRGAYPMINREFAARELPEFTYINREEDTGDEGLRKAKLSYRPVKLLKKYDAVCKD